jgi:membrane-associated phospholipid phosphatase
MGVRLRPTEAIHFAALLTLTALTVLLRERLADPSGMLLRYAALAAGLAVIGVLARRPEGLATLPALLVDFYPAAFLPIVFNTLSPLIHAARGRARDEVLIAADRRLFGTDVTVWLQRLVHPALNDVFFVFYATYYFLALTLGLILWRRDRETARRFIFTLMVVYYVSYAGYFLVPAWGPRFAQDSLYTTSLVSTPVSRAISNTIDALEKTKFDVFPSGHTMIAVTVLLVARKRARDTFRYFLPVALGLIFSTVYCRYHYAVDVIAGAALAVVFVPVGDWLYARWVGRPAFLAAGLVRPADGGPA